MQFEVQISKLHVARCTSRRGFTIIELLVSMLLTSIIMGAIYSVYRVQTHSAKVQGSRLEAQEYARSVLDMMVREIRNAGYFPTGTACSSPANTSGIVAADAQSFQFVYDFDANGDCLGPDENITYAFSTAGCASGFVDITRKEGANAAQPMTDCNVPTGTANFSFTYYPQDSITAYATPVASGSLGSIQRVLISLTVQSKKPDTEFGGQLNATMTSNADLRNRGLPS